jgi:hypothetical protein
MQAARDACICRASMCWAVVVALGCMMPEAGAKDWEARGCKAALKVAAEVATHGCAGFEAFVLGNETMIAGWQPRARRRQHTDTHSLRI